MTSAADEARRLRELARRYEEQAEKLDRLEPVALALSELGDGSVVAFMKQFNPNPPKAYGYAAIKEVGKWFLTTGSRRNSSPRSDAELAHFLGSGWAEGMLWAPDTLEVLRRVEPEPEELCPTCGSEDRNRTEPWYYKVHGRGCRDGFHDDADGEG